MALLVTAPLRLTARRLGPCALLCLALLFASHGAPAEELRPEAVKAAFLLNFAKFARWPAQAAEAMRFCFPTVAELVGSEIQRQAGNDLNGQSLEVRRGVNEDDLPNCRLVYLGQGDAHRIGEVLIALGNTPVLTVSDLPGFLAKGGMIELTPEGRKFRFSVNLEALRRNGVELDGRLLGLARNLGGGGGEGQQLRQPNQH